MNTGSHSRFCAVVGLIDRSTAFGNIIAALSLLAIFVLIAGEIIIRNLSGFSLSFSWDFAAYLMGSTFMMAAASALKSGSHVRVTAITEILSPRGGRMLDMLACLLGLAISVALTYALIEMAWLSFQRGSTSSSVIRTPLVYPQAVLAAGGVLLTLQMVAQSLRLTRGETLTTGPGLE
ncbi:TRAP transporter small permease subunit [Pararhizobium sp. LjRoot238]|uniref:TRAP transporter small permease subunit n=1 Tax=Pararhizobium sp. LjRoot238 TaxID=3342293 RepID=UPI003ECD456C